MIRGFYMSWLTFLVGSSCYCQFNPGVEGNAHFMNDLKLSSYTVSDYNENETFTDYKVKTELNPISMSFGIRNFGTQFQSLKKNCIGYSLGIGYHQFSTTGQLSFLRSSTSNRDSIVTRLHIGYFKSIYRSIFMSHFFDVHWNPSDRIKITNSIGLNITVMVQTKSLNTNITQRALVGNLPLFKLIYQPQITESYARCSISYFAQFTLFATDLLKKSASNQFVKPFGTPFSSLRFNSIGLRCMPHLKPPKIMPNDELL